MSLCHTSVILTILQYFYMYYVCYGDLLLEIFDVTIVIVLWHQELYPQTTANLIDKCVYSDAPLTSYSPSLSLSSDFNIERRQINNPLMPLRVQLEGKVPCLLF